MTSEKLNNFKEDILYVKETGSFIKREDGTPVKESKLAKGYRAVCYKGASLASHRLAFLLVTGTLPVNDVDHINGDRSDNRWCNLRLVTRQQNLFNIKANLNRTLPKNVYKHSSGKYRVKMKIDGITKHFGYFASLEKAANKAKEVQRLFHKEYAPC